MYMIRSSEVAKCYHRDMSQPVKLSDELVLDARLTAEIAERSIAGQIEFWAQLGRAIEPLLEGAQSIGPAKGR
jgi:ParD-like antitoxin of type II bacterial toxin-antitoxin system